jgi:tRNA dimethylallyltransferase
MVPKDYVMKPIIVIVGPTAIGKSKLGVAVAKAFQGQIISGDALQFYQGLDIGTAKISVEERDGIPHHLIDTLLTTDQFSVARYQTEVRAKIESLQNEATIPILVGGSGLYLQSVLFDYRFPGTVRDQVVETDLDLLGNAELMAQLVRINPELAQTIHVNNRRRLLRAIQISMTSPVEKENRRQVPFYSDVIIIGLRAPREIVYQRINLRVDDMIQSGLVAEALGLYQHAPDSQAAQAIGYKELFPYFEGKETLEQAIETIKLHSRRYAKRQMTWFQNQMDVRWFEVDYSAFEKTVEDVIEWLTLETNKK